MKLSPLPSAISWLALPMPWPFRQSGRFPRFGKGAGRRTQEGRDRRVARCIGVIRISGQDCSLLFMKRLARDYPDRRTMQGMIREGESLTGALEAGHRDEFARDDANLPG